MEGRRAHLTANQRPTYNTTQNWASDTKLLTANIELSPSAQNCAQSNMNLSCTVQNYSKGTVRPSSSVQNDSEHIEGWVYKCKTTHSAKKRPFQIHTQGKTTGPLQYTNWDSDLPRLQVKHQLTLIWVWFLFLLERWKWLEHMICWPPSRTLPAAMQNSPEW